MPILSALIYIGLVLFIAIIAICIMQAPPRVRIFVLVFAICNLFSGMVFSSNMIHFLVWPAAMIANTQLIHSSTGKTEERQLRAFSYAATLTF